MEFHGKSERYISSLRASLLPNFRGVEVSEHLRSSTRSCAHIHPQHPLCRTVLPPGSPRTLTLLHKANLRSTKAECKSCSKGLQLGHLDRPHPSASPQLCTVLQDPWPYSGHFSPHTLPALRVFLQRGRAAHTLGYGTPGSVGPWSCHSPSISAYTNSSCHFTSKQS